MKTKTITLMIILFLITISFSSAIGIGGNFEKITMPLNLNKLTPQNPGLNPSKPLNVWVDDNYTPSTPGFNKTRFNNIQNAIDAVAKNGKVKVFNGIYFENILIDKKLSLIGEDRQNTIIDANHVGTVINITTEGVKIKSFTIQNSGYDWEDEGIELNSNKNIITNNNIIFNEYGIAIDSYHENIIENNNISSTCLFGLRLHLSTNNTIKSNVFWNNSKGISFWDSCNNNIISDNFFIDNFHGIGMIYDSKNNKIIGNTFNNCSSEAINLNFNCNNNELISNTIIYTGGYGHAVYFIDCSENTILNNSITYNKQSGIYLKNCNSFSIVGNTIGYNVYQGLVIYPSGTGHQIYHNNFMNNLYKNVVDAGTNTWDNGFEGNYYDDFEQNPGYPNIYEIYGGDNIDNHPLLRPYE